MSAAAAPSTLDLYAQVVDECVDDPWRWIQQAYPWGVKGTALQFKEPHDWHREAAQYIARQLKGMKDGSIPEGPIRVVRKAGHGVGKSAFMAQMIGWCLGTMPDARAMATANTETQLRTKTWPEVGKWHRMSISEPFFNHTATTLRSIEQAHCTSWSAEAVPWSENNPDAFQGLHNAGKRLLIMFDEASGIPPIIWESIEGAMTDANTQIIWLVFGNPLRNSGRFYQCFGKFKHHWNCGSIDSRDVPGTNLELFKEWADMYGEDSDFYKIRVTGEFPAISAVQFIALASVEASMERRAYCRDDDPLICGLDFARNGNCANVMYWRKGRDGKSFKPDIFPDNPSTEHFVAKCAARLRDMRPDLIYGDGVGLGGPIIDRLVGLGFDVIDVQSGGRAAEHQRHANKRAEMWARGKYWIRDGGALWDNDGFQAELTTMETVPNVKGLTQLESKEQLLKRGEPSPDVADAFMFTFAYDSTDFAAAEHRESLGFNKSVAEYDPLQDLDVEQDEDGYNKSRHQRTQRRFYTGA